MKKLPLILLPFFFFAFCCTPYQEPKLPPAVTHKVEYVYNVPPPVFDIFEAAIAKLPEIRDVPILVVEDFDTSMARVSCYSPPDQCVIGLNTDVLMRVRFMFGGAPIAFILGHELGHIPDLLDFGETEYTDWELELRADRVGGCIVKRLEYDPRFMDDFIDYHLDGGFSHPPAEDRIEAYEEGYACE